MTNRIIELQCLLLPILCIAAAAQTEPKLVTVNMPTYPPLARQARIEGMVKLTFTLPANAKEPASIEVVSGHPALNGAAIESVKSWRFENPYAVERKYETTFRYQLSGVEVLHAETTVTFKSFHQVELVTDLAEPTVNY
jgi:TonB family protein